MSLLVQVLVVRNVALSATHRIETPRHRKGHKQESSQEIAGLAGEVLPSPLSLLYTVLLEREVLL